MLIYVSEIVAGSVPAPRQIAGFPKTRRVPGGFGLCFAPGMYFKYSGYGLTIRVPFQCAALRSAAGEDEVDLTVTEGRVPRRLRSPVIGGPAWDAEPDRFLLRTGRRGGRFLVEGGQVTLERNPEADGRVLARAFVTVVLAAALAQRGRLVLHANAAELDGRAIVIAGGSGAGKSTTLAAMLGAGCRMLADDITVARLASDGRVEVLPGAGEVRLTHASSSRLGLDLPAELEAPWGLGKAALPAGARLATVPSRLERMYVLETSDAPGVDVTPLAGSEKFDALIASVYGPLFAAEHDRVFPVCAAVLEQAQLFRIRRPAADWSIEQVSTVLLDGATR